MWCQMILRSHQRSQLLSEAGNFVKDVFDVRRGCTHLASFFTPDHDGSLAAPGDYPWKYYSADVPWKTPVLAAVPWEEKKVAGMSLSSRGCLLQRTGSHPGSDQPFVLGFPRAFRLSVVVCPFSLVQRTFAQCLLLMRFMMVPHSQEPQLRRKTVTLHFA